MQSERNVARTRHSNTQNFGYYYELVHTWAVKKNSPGAPFKTIFCDGTCVKEEKAFWAHHNSP